MKPEKSNFRWYMLGLSMMAFLLIGGLSRMGMPVLFDEISRDLGLSLTAIGVVWGMDPLAGVFIGLPGGLLADRFGVRKTITVVCILAGVFGAARGFSFNFITMSLSMFLFGIMAATMPTIVPKVTAQWFKGKELGVTNALLNILWSIGAMISTIASATLFSPLLGGWRRVMFLYGLPCVLLGILWFLTGREPEVRERGGREGMDAETLKASLLHVLSIRDIRFLGLVLLTLWGSSMGLIGYLPLYLRNIGWSPVRADSAITLLSGISCIGAVPVVLLSERIGSRKKVLLFSMILMLLSLFMLPFFTGATVWFLLALNGFMRTGAFALINVIIIEMKEVGTRYSGTAIGLVSSFGMMGAFAAPPIGNSMNLFGPGYPFIFWALLLTAGLPLFLQIKSVDRK